MKPTLQRKAQTEEKSYDKNVWIEGLGWNENDLVVVHTPNEGDHPSVPRFSAYNSTSTQKATETSRHASLAYLEALWKQAQQLKTNICKPAESDGTREQSKAISEAERQSRQDDKCKKSSQKSSQNNDRFDEYIKKYFRNDMTNEMSKKLNEPVEAKMTTSKSFVKESSAKASFHRLHPPTSQVDSQASSKATSKVSKPARASHKQSTPMPDYSLTNESQISISSSRRRSRFTIASLETTKKSPLQSSDKDRAGATHKPPVVRVGRSTDKQRMQQTLVQPLHHIVQSTAVSRAPQTAKHITDKHKIEQHPHCIIKGARPEGNRPSSTAQKPQTIENTLSQPELKELILSPPQATKKVALKQQSTLSITEDLRKNLSDKVLSLDRLSKTVKQVKTQLKQLQNYSSLGRFYSLADSYVNILCTYLAPYLLKSFSGAHENRSSLNRFYGQSSTHFPWMQLVSLSPTCVWTLLHRYQLGSTLYSKPERSGTCALSSTMYQTSSFTLRRNRLMRPTVQEARNNNGTVDKMDVFNFCEEKELLKPQLFVLPRWERRFVGIRDSHYLPGSIVFAWRDVTGLNSSNWRWLQNTMGQLSYSRRRNRRRLVN